MVYKPKTLKEKLNDSEQDLDQSIKDELQSRRRMALDSLNQHIPKREYSWRLPAVATLTTFGIALGIWYGSEKAIESTTPSMDLFFADAELLNDSEDLLLLEELELYDWLSQQEEKES